MKKIIIISLGIIFLGLSLWFLFFNQKNSPTLSLANKTNNSEIPANAKDNNQKTDSPTLALPIDRATERLTKKTFGTYVTPKNSPVSPEIFTGYHTAIDFETFPDEQKTDVPIYSICDGPLLLKKSVSGYGGVLVQKCLLNKETVTIIYGHLKLSSISVAMADELKKGDKIGILGTGYSSETSNERKHLHLSIHQGTSVVLLGYVKNKSELSNWLDPKIVLGL